MEKRWDLTPILLGVAAVLIVGYGGASWYLWANQRELIFFPSREVQRTPSDLQLQYGFLRIHTAGQFQTVALTSLFAGKQPLTRRTPDARLIGLSSPSSPFHWLRRNSLGVR